MTSEPDQQTIERRMRNADASFGFLVNLVDWFWIAVGVVGAVALGVAYLLGWIGN